MNRARIQSGFAYIAAVVLLVVVAGLAVALLRLSATQQSTVDQALLGARAGLAARGGVEWAFRVLDTPYCEGAPVQLPQLRAESGFHVTVTCSYNTYSEGERIRMPAPGGDPEPVAEPLTKRIYRITAVACNGAGAGCPDPGSVAGADYVERARTATVCVVQALDDKLEPCET